MSTTVEQESEERPFLNGLLRLDGVANLAGGTASADEPRQDSAAR